PDFEAPADADGNNIYDVIVQVSDGIVTDTQAIAVTVTNANDPPSFNPSRDPVGGTDESGQVCIDHWATAISSGAPDETAQTVHFALSNDNNDIFRAQP